MHLFLAALLLTQLIFGSEENSLRDRKTPIKVFHNAVRNEEYPKLGDKEIKDKIGDVNLQRMSNGLFDCVSGWHFAPQTDPLVREILFAMSENVCIEKRNKFNQTPLMISGRFGTEKVISLLPFRTPKTEFHI